MDQMRLLDRLERRIGNLGIRNLALYIVIGNAAVWLLGFAFQSNYTLADLLMLSRAAVLRGEVWRIVTFALLTSFGGSVLTVILELYFIYMIGTNLEYSWGSFKLTFYYFAGLLLTVAVSLVTGIGVRGARYLHLSLFFAFAQLAPEMRIMLFFIIPVKIKWLAWISWAFTALEFIRAEPWQQRLVILAPITVFLFFFWRDILYFIRSKKKSSANRGDFHRKVRAAKIVKTSFHKCEVCGRTELDSPDMDFRYCSKCEGNYEYCSDHLRDHNHRSS